MRENFIEWLKRKRQERKDKIKVRQFKHGFSFAAGKLLLGESTPMGIESHQDMQNIDSFDLGMDAAIDKLVELGIVEDDRI